MPGLRKACPALDAGSPNKEETAFEESFAEPGQWRKKTPSPSGPCTTGTRAGELEDTLTSGACLIDSSLSVDLPFDRLRACPVFDTGANGKDTSRLC